MSDTHYRDWTIRLTWRGNRYRVVLITPPPQLPRRFAKPPFDEYGQTLPGVWGPGSRERAIEFAKMRIDMCIDGTGKPLATPAEMGKAMKRLRKLNAEPWKLEQQA